MGILDKLRRIQSKVRVGQPAEADKLRNLVINKPKTHSKKIIEPYL
jgi:hypothetical protein